MRAFFPKLISAAASVALTAGMVALASPAAAASIETPRQLVVQTADLDLAAPEGRATVERRIRAAANEVCSIADSFETVERPCRDRAIAEAMSNLGQPSGEVH